MEKTAPRNHHELAFLSHLPLVLLWRKQIPIKYINHGFFICRDGPRIKWKNRSIFLTKHLQNFFHECWKDITLTVTVVVTLKI